MSIAHSGALEALSSLMAPPWALTTTCLSDRASRRKSSIRCGDDDESFNGYECLEDGGRNEDGHALRGWY